MIEKPEIGMRVKVVDANHCCSEAIKINHSGNGVIVKIGFINSFLVKMDKYPNSDWFRCCECVSSI